MVLVIEAENKEHFEDLHNLNINFPF